MVTGLLAGGFELYCTVEVKNRNLVSRVPSLALDEYERALGTKLERSVVCILTSVSSPLSLLHLTYLA